MCDRLIHVYLILNVVGNYECCLQVWCLFNKAYTVLFVVETKRTLHNYFPTCTCIIMKPVKFMCMCGCVDTYLSVMYNCPL